MKHIDAVNIRKNHDLTKRLLEAVTNFVSHTEGVLDNDWYFSLMNLDEKTIGFYINPGGTFLNPKVSDPSNNWANRGAFLNSYEKLVVVMKEAGIYEYDELEELNAVGTDSFKYYQ